MADWVSYLADLTDPTYVARDVDLNGYEVGLSPFETDHETFDLGAPEMDGVWLNEAGKDEDVLSAHRRGRVEASFDLRIGPGSQSFASLQTQLRKLNAALDRSGVWVLQQPGASTPLYIDYYPSPLIQQLMPGQRSLYFLWTQLQQPNGMRVKILRRPKMRAAALNAAVNLAHNGTLAEDHDADGIPTFWSWSDVTGLSAFDYDWTFGAHVLQFATGGSKFFSQDSDAALIEEGDTYTFAIDVAAVYSAQPTVKARIDWIDVDENVLSTSYGSTLGVLFNPRIAFSRPSILGAVAPSGAVTARYGVEITPVNTATVTLYVRDCQFQTGLVATTFRAGFETITQSPELPFYKRTWQKNAANADALAQIRATPDTGGSVAQMVYARRSGERDSAMAMRVLSGWLAVDSTALQHGTTSVSDGGRTVAKTALTDDVLRSVLRQEVLSPEESALRGTWRLRVSLRGDLSDAYKIMPRYGFGDVADLPFTTLPNSRRLDNTAPPSESDYLNIDLGLFTVPPLSPGVFFEIHAMRETTEDGDGDGELYIDQFWIEPADDDLYGIASVPGAQRAGPVSETVIGRKLITPPDGLANDPVTSDPFVAGSIYNDDMLLNTLLEAASLPAAMTDDLTAGVEHTYTIDTILYTESEKLARKHGEFRIHDLTTDTQVKMVSLKNNPGEAWSQKYFTLKFTPTAAHAYLVYVVLNTTGIGNIHWQAIHHSFVPPVVATETIAIDADQRRAYVLLSDQFKAALDLAGPYPLLQPNVQLVRFSFAGLASNGTDDVLDGAAALSHDPDLTAEVGIHQVPRYFN